MPTIGNTNPTLADLARRLDPSKKIDKIVEILMTEEEILDDMVVIEGNLPTGHRATVRSSLPEPTWRRLNQGVPVTKTGTTQVTAACGMLEDYGEVDKSLADLNGNSADWRLSEDRGKIQAFSKAVAGAIFYGNSDIYPEMPMGLGPIFSASSTDTDDPGSHVLKAGGSGSDNTSIWLVGWGQDTVHGFFPQGSKAGLQMNDKGQVTLTDASGGQYEGYRTHYKWDIGLMVRDWRYVVRIANIDVNELTKDASTGADLIDLMIQATELIPSLRAGRPAWYCNRTISSFLRRQILNKSNVLLNIEEIAGKRVTTFDSIPVRRVDALLNTESTVS